MNKKHIVVLGLDNFGMSAIKQYQNIIVKL